jgi:hypothetical protein
VSYFIPTSLSTSVIAEEFRPLVGGVLPSSRRIRRTRSSPLKMRIPLQGVPTKPTVEAVKLTFETMRSSVPFGL